jgi:hypothetical protein
VRETCPLIRRQGEHLIVQIPSSHDLIISTQDGQSIRFRSPRRAVQNGGRPSLMTNSSMAAPIVLPSPERSMQSTYLPKGGHREAGAGDLSGELVHPVYWRDHPATPGRRASLEITPYAGMAGWGASFGEEALRQA